MKNNNAIIQPIEDIINYEIITNDKNEYNNKLHNDNIKLNIQNGIVSNI